MNSVLYTPSEVAEKLRVNREVIYKWLQAGKLKGRKIGNLWRVSESDLDEFLNN
ncbi:MAG: helix-turn-helix domain-containing protein [Bacteroidales bacterium]|jgi:excisionase family DNA binding protein